MEDPRDQSADVLSLLYNIVAIPYNLLSGFIVGSIVPVAAVAGIVAGIRLLTGKMPYLSATDVDGERQICINLVTPEAARDAFARDREEIGGQIEHMRTEIQAIIEEARAEAEEAVRAEIDDIEEEVSEE